MTVGWRTGEPPKIEEEYLVQLRGGGFAIGRWVNWNHFWPSLKTDQWWWAGLPQYSTVVAWMELPEPMKVAEIEVRHIPEEADVTCCSGCGNEIEDFCDYCPCCGALLISEEKK